MANPKPRLRWKREYVRRVSIDTFTPDVMKTIARTLAISSEEVIAHLLTEIADAMNLYVSFKEHSDKRPSPGEKQAALRSLLSQLNKSVTIFEKLDEDSLIAVELAAAGSKKSSIYEVISDGDFEIQAEGEEITKIEIGHLYNLRDHVEAALKNLSKPKRGPQKKVAKRVLYWKLADIYKQHTGKRATVSSYEGGHGGPFVDFVEACLKPIGRVQSTSALGKQVKDALSERGRLKQDKS